MSLRKYTDLELACAVATSKTMREVLLLLGLAPLGGNYESVRRRIVELKLEAAHLHTHRGRRRLASCSDDEIIGAVGNSRSIAEVLRRLGLRSGTVRVALKERLEELELDISHFSGQGWRRGSTSPVVPAAPLEKILVEGRLIPTWKLKHRLFSEGLKDCRCEACGRDSWNGSPIPLELDHVNGRRDDNRLSNLRVLCPNCHAQTDTYRGRNIGAATGYSDDSSEPGWRNRQPQRS